MVNPQQKRFTNTRYSKSLAAAEEAVKGKLDSYKADVHVAGNPRFIPLVFESTGGIQRLVLETVEVCTRRFGDEVPEDSTWVCSTAEQYWLQAISCALWRGNAEVVLTYFQSVQQKQGMRHMLPATSAIAGRD